jgi:hypothetical protein
MKAFIISALSALILEGGLAVLKLGKAEAAPAGFKKTTELRLKQFTVNTIYR